LRRKLGNGSHIDTLLTIFQGIINHPPHHPNSIRDCDNLLKLALSGMTTDAITTGSFTTDSFTTNSFTTDSFTTGCFTRDRTGSNARVLQRERSFDRRR
jgi:hypothetical protein